MQKAFLVPARYKGILTTTICCSISGIQTNHVAGSVPTSASEDDYVYLCVAAKKVVDLTDFDWNMIQLEEWAKTLGMILCA